VSLFADQLRGALEGNATHDVCRVVEETAEEHHLGIADRQRDFWRGVAAAGAFIEAAE
jgi:hypothetical protein